MITKSLECLILFTVSVTCSFTPLILQAPSFAFHAIITTGSVIIFRTYDKNREKTEACPVTATQNGGTRPYKM
jgi:hypothetical protein